MSTAAVSIHGVVEAGTTTPPWAELQITKEPNRFGRIELTEDDVLHLVAQSASVLAQMREIQRDRA